MSAPTPPARRTRRRGAPAGLLAVGLAVVLASCTGSGDGGGATPGPDVGTPLASVDTTTLAVTRGPWCDQLPAEAVERALGGPPATSSAYESGDRARITPDVRDVAHEFSCTFVGEDGTTARAWVFAPPVTRAQAGRLVRVAGSAEGCRRVRDAPDFGRPSVATICQGEGRSGTGAAASTVASYAGLFGDAWLSCSLGTPSAESASAESAERDVLDRAGRWCVAVANTADPS